MRMMATRATIAALVLACVNPSRAQHDAHEHGHARLNVVLDGTLLAMELEVPAANVVGFEHQPKTDAQWQRSEQAIRGLARTEDVFVTPEAAACSPREAALALPGLRLHEGELERIEGGHEEHDNKDDDEGRAEHDAVHGELVAEYLWQCENPQALTDVDVMLFQQLENLEALAVQVVTSSRQAAVELSPGSTKVRLVP